MIRRAMGGLPVIMLLFASVGLAASDPAPADSTQAIPSGIPELRGHRFVPTPLVPSPFVQTFLRNTLGMASARNITTPDFEFGGETVPGLKGNLNAVILTFEYQMALKRWLALRAQFGITGQYGTGVQTLLSEGVATSVDFQFGWVFALRQGNSSMLSGSVMFTNRTVTSVSIYNLVSDIVDGTNLGLSRATPVLNGLLDLRWAWATSDLVGFTAVAGVGTGETLDRTKGSEVFYRGGLAMSFDFQRWDLPLGAALGGRTDNFGGLDAEERAGTWEAGLHLSYIGRDSFVLSLGYSWAAVPTTGRLKEFDASWLALSIHYFF